MTGNRALDGQVAIVTGASRGIGADIARHLAAAGAKVVLAARTEEQSDPRLPGTIHSVAADIQASGGEALPVRTNVREPDSVEGCVARAVEHFGRLDILVNNAAVMVPGDIGGVQPRHLDLIWQVDLRGPLLMVRSALPHMRTAGGGHIINVSSGAARMPGPGPYAQRDRSGAPTGISIDLFYGMVKAGLDRVTQGLAMDLQASKSPSTASRRRAPCARPGTRSRTTTRSIRSRSSSRRTRWARQPSGSASSRRRATPATSRSTATCCERRGCRRSGRPTRRSPVIPTDRQRAPRSRSSSGRYLAGDAPTPTSAATARTASATAWNGLVGVAQAPCMRL